MLWQLIQSGAFIYLCGHGRAAVRSIEQALRRVIEEHSSLSDAEITAYMDRLKSTNHLCY
jgi:sulfite reductase (NADPH) flavoprotein alpha-component